MARVAAIVLAGVTFVLSPLMVFGNDAPHNETFGIQCSNCHGQKLQNSLNDSISSPFWDRSGLNDSLENDRRNLLCQSCHNEMTSGYTPIKAPIAKTHSSYTIGSWFKNNDSNWSRLCTECHNPHYQEQKNNYDRSKYNDSSEWKAPIYLASGIIIGYSYDNESLTSNLYYYNTRNRVHFKEGWNFDRIANKSLENRHAIVLPNIASPSFNYSILQINENAGIMTVMGDVSKGIYRYQDTTSEEDAKSETAPKKYFGIIYGQLLKSKINGKPVVFYEKTGPNSFADNDSTRNGICEVCHTKTDHFRNNGTGPDQEHLNPLKDAQGAPIPGTGKIKAGTNCIECHRHELGFHHSNNGGDAVCTECHYSNKHLQHLKAGENCGDCHDLQNMRDSDGVINSPIMRTISTTGQSPCEKCHFNPSDGGPPNDVDYINHWNDSSYTLGCSGCHNGRPTQLDPDNIDQKFRIRWNDSSLAFYNESMVMSSGGHNRLVGVNSIRHYPCSECHFLSVNISTDKTIWSYKRKHTNGHIDVDIDPAEAITGSKQLPYYDRSMNSQTGRPNNCFALYCHSDGTQKNPEVRPYSWFDGPRRCNFCHGHDENSDCSKCHTDHTGWDNDNMWFSAMPMYKNEGAGAAKANSHFKHILDKGKSCDACHAATVKGNSCVSCHTDPETGLPIKGAGKMEDNGHIYPDYHVNHEKTVKFKDAPNATYDLVSKTCKNTLTTGCHGPKAMIWGSAVDSKRACYGCHLTTTGNDTDDYTTQKNDIQARISQQEWLSSGHGRPAASGPYPESGNPAANFNDSNECWYCHDPGVWHPNNPANPFRLRLHESYAKRFEKECMYCHNTESTAECLSCHNDDASKFYSPQIGIPTTNDTERLALFTDEAERQNHVAYRDTGASCVTACHATDETRHKTGSNDSWTETDKADVRNQYLMMGVCLQCHDDDTGGQCNSCHAYGDNDPRYQRGFNPMMNDSRLIVPQQAKASSAHFGYKHYKDFERNGIWKGGKFCWDCHDPHGDKNIYMIHDKVNLETEGKFGQPTNDSGKWNQAEVVFIAKDTGTDYAKSGTGPFNGICQVCHSAPTESNDSHAVAAHYYKGYGDLHNYNIICTSCHEHRFTNSHSSGDPCNECHRSKPVPRHTAFSLPRDCTKCHRGIRKRIDVMGQFKGNSHHVQRPDGTIKNVDCYPCHWEATVEGLINVEHHEGYNYKKHTGTKDDRVDLVLMGPNGKRPRDGNESRPSEFKILNDSNSATATATVFYANTIGTANERKNVEQITPHCLSCHSNQNNETKTFFGDCKTPKQYSWDGSSIAARYSNLGTTIFGKYTDYPNAAPKNIVKAFSAHGNAINNQGGYNDTTGINGVIPNTRAGSRNVQCFDCHSSHGSKVTGVTSAYMDYKGGYNGGNLKETKAGEGGYVKSYKASRNSNDSSANPFKDQAGQCFDCHETEYADTGTKPKPWGYKSTFNDSKAIVGYKDNKQFKGSHNGIYSYKNKSSINKHSTQGGHLKASSPLLGLNDSPNSSTRHTVQGSINGICTPCHDPHGVSPSLGTEYMPYAVPLLKGTWLTSPYKEDAANTFIPAPGYVNTYNTGADAGSGDGGGKDDRPLQPNRYKKFNLDRYIFTSGSNTNKIYEAEDKFAGLCLRCHPKNSLTDGIKKNRPWKSLDRVHESVKGWGNNIEHNYPCSKCHQPHASGLPRLMTTNCLDAKHRGQLPSGGKPFATSNPHVPAGNGRFPQDCSYSKRYDVYDCHESSIAINGVPGSDIPEWEDQRWNTKTLWPNDSFNHGNK